jgi:hypothetical protein
MASKDKSVASVRQMFGAALLQEATQEEINQLVADVLGTKKARKIACPECGVEFRVEWPDVKGQVDTVIALTEQTEGKASSEQLEAAHVTIVRPPRG